MVLAFVCEDPKDKHPSLWLVDEFRLQGDYVPTQRDFLFNLKKQWTDKGYRVSVVIDATVVGDVVADAFGPLIDYRVWYTGSTQKPEIDKYGAWKYAKKNLVHMLQVLIDTRAVKAFATMKTLIEEIRNFKMYHSSSGNVKYDALVGHDDVVNASMLCSFYYGFLLGHASVA